MAGALVVMLFVVMALMFIGGASGSTAGGIKVSTFGLLGAVIEQVTGEPLADVLLDQALDDAAGAGDPLPPEVVRAMMLLLAASLARGHSGVRTRLRDRLLALALDIELGNPNFGLTRGRTVR